MLLGVVMPDGQVALLPAPLEVDADFMEVAHQGRSPRKRFRFASACMRGACQQWTGSACGVIERVLDDELLTLLPMAEALPSRVVEPPCAIRGQCRWYSQRGALACQGCAFVITDMLDAEPVATEPVTAAS